MIHMDQLAQEGPWPGAPVSTEGAGPRGLAAESCLASALPAAGVMRSPLNLVGLTVGALRWRGGGEGGVGSTGRGTGLGTRQGSWRGIAAPHPLLIETTLQSVNRRY